MSFILTNITNASKIQWAGHQYPERNWTNLTIQNNLTQQINPRLLNFTNTTLLTEEEKDTSLGVLIAAIFMMVILSLVILACLSLFFVVFCSECRNRNTIYIGYRHRFSENDSTYSDSSDSGDEEINSFQNTINKKQFVYEPNKYLLQETPLNKIIIQDTEIEEINCAICLEPIILNGQTNKAVQLSCHHIYHQKCISSWYFNGVTSVSKCPLCREKMEHIVITVDYI